MYDNPHWITISANKRQNHRQMSSKSPLFRVGERYKIKALESSLTFNLCLPTDDGKAYTASRLKDMYVHFNIVAEIPTGHFEIDQEESTPDCIKVYFE